MEVANSLLRGKSSVVDSWLFMSSELPISILVLFYLLIVTFVLPRFMKNRAAYSLKHIMRVYNFSQVVFCASIVIQFFRAGWTFSSALSCESQLSKTSYMRILEIWWCCVFIRSAEFLETIFFILRKKSSQVTFLHVYHHVSSIFIVWIPLKYGGNIGWLIHGVINAQVHVLMYIFYLLTTFKSFSYLTKLMKPLLTFMQISQLVALSMHCVYALRLPCSSGSILYWIHFFNLTILIFFFIKFYIQAYKSKKVH